eukprot:EG_transcript_11553
MAALFFLLVHGNHGHAAQFDYWVEQISLRFPDALCLASSVNEHTRTHDGLLMLGGRLVGEVSEFLEDRGLSTAPLSLVAIGHSLGGLILRAALPELLKAHPALQPVSYFSLQTPHLGSRRPHGGSWFQHTKRYVVHNVLDRFNAETGQELLLQDEAQVLRLLSKPDGPYTAALRRFPHITFAAVVHGDWIVPCTAAAAYPKPSHLLPTGDWPSLAVCGHLGFEGPPAALLDAARPRPTEPSDRLCCWPSAAGKAASCEDQAVFTKGQMLTLEANGPPADLTPGKYAVDSAGEQEYCPAMLADLELALPRLRRLFVQSRQTWPHFVVHLLWLYQSVGRIEAGRRLVGLVLDVIGADLQPDPAGGEPLQLPLR